MVRTGITLAIFGTLLLATLSSAPLAAAQGGAPSVPPATTPFDQAAALAQLKAAIAGKEELPAGEVFKNIQQYKGVTAARFVRIMEFGFTVSLGVDCTHCHVPGQWDLDTKVTKQIAREMTVMLGNINNEFLRKIPNLRSTNPSVNCTTCHRGQTRPALELPVAAQATGQR